MAQFRGAFDMLNRALTRYLEPNYESLARSTRLPSNAKIALYGSYNFLFTHIINRSFEQYNRVDIKNLIGDSQASNEGPDNAVIEAVANQLTTIGPDFVDAYIMEDFPRTAAQAERLDQLLDGINLAVNIQVKSDLESKLGGKFLQCKSCGLLYNTELNSTLPQLPGLHEKCQTPTRCNISETKVDGKSQSADYTKTYKPVFDYYNKRGLLLNFVVEEQWTFEETITRLTSAIESQIKH